MEGAMTCQNVLTLLLFLALFPFAPPTHKAWNQLCHDLPKMTAESITIEEADAVRELVILGVVGAQDNVLSAYSVNEACANYQADQQDL